jgi:hypothetical protein
MSFTLFMFLCLNSFLVGQQILNPIAQDPLNQVAVNNGQIQAINTTPPTAILDPMLTPDTPTETTTKDTEIVAIVFRNFKDFKKSGFNFKKT